MKNTSPLALILCLIASGCSSMATLHSPRNCTVVTDGRYAACLDEIALERWMKRNWIY